MNKGFKGFIDLIKSSKLFMFALIFVLVNAVLLVTCGALYVSNKSNTSYSSSSSSGKKKSSDAYKSSQNYDAGYNAIYEDDDYSYTRYKNDPDYASGVDDAIDDLDWD